MSDNRLLVTRTPRPHRVTRGLHREGSQQAGREANFVGWRGRGTPWFPHEDVVGLSERLHELAGTETGGSGTGGIAPGPFAKAGPLAKGPRLQEQSWRSICGQDIRSLPSFPQISRHT